MSAWKIFHSQFKMESTTSEHSCQVVQNDDARLALLKGDQWRGVKGLECSPVSTSQPCSLAQNCTCVLFNSYKDSSYSL